MCWTACYCGWVLTINIDMQHDKLESYILITCACAWWLTFIYMFIRWSTVCHSWPWWVVSRRDRYNQIALCGRYLFFNSPPCRPLCSILIYSALLLRVHSASLSFMVDHIARPRGILVIAVVLCLTHYITDFYTYSTYFFTAIFLTPPYTLPFYFFCPKTQRRH